MSSRSNFRFPPHVCALVRAEQEVADAATSPQLKGATCDRIQESSVLPVRKTGTNAD